MREREDKNQVAEEIINSINGDVCNLSSCVDAAFRNRHQPSIPGEILQHSFALHDCSQQGFPSAAAFPDPPPPSATARVRGPVGIVPLQLIFLCSLGPMSPVPNEADPEVPRMDPRILIFLLYVVILHELVSGWMEYQKQLHTIKPLWLLQAFAALGAERAVPGLAESGANHQEGMRMPRGSFLKLGMGCSLILRHTIPCEVCTVRATYLSSCSSQCESIQVPQSASLPDTSLPETDQAFIAPRLLSRAQLKRQE
nr:uncharacterized protein LOC101946363 isoform X1 [Chrysemys picta bellii]